jgi:PEP-CTERM motif/Metallo-peptidase family M12B Reprolysin-like
MTTKFKSRMMLSAALAASAMALPTTASAAVIDKTLTINVFQLCNDAGASCASLGPSGNNFFQAEVSKIWAQAGIEVLWSSVTKINSTAFQFIEDGTETFEELTGSFGAPGQSSPTIVDMYLVRGIGGAFGLGWLGAGGFAIGMDDVMAFNGGLGRIDTIAHELGHNLGLPHTSVANELMAPGNLRNVPTTINDIAPDGLGRDVVNASQITTVRGSTLLRPRAVAAVPEASTWAMMLFGFGLVGSLLRRRDRRLRLA